jgi:hypothetical protein
MLNKGPAKLLSLFALIFLFYLFLKTQEQGKILGKTCCYHYLAFLLTLYYTSKYSFWRTYHETVVEELETVWGGSKQVRSVVYKAFTLAGKVKL